MNLYTLELNIHATLERFPLNLSGWFPFAEVGGWTVPTDKGRYFGQSSGTWRVFKVQGDPMIQLMESDDPNFISWLWRDMPYSKANLDGILRFPLVPDETGTGYITNSFTLGWRVSRRHF